MQLDEDGYTVSFSLGQVADIRQFFDEYGFVVVRDVLTPEACGATLDEIFDALESGTEGQFRRHDMSTWSAWPRNSIVRYGNVSRPPLFTPQFLRNRCNARVHAVFALLLGQSDLLVSHDRAGFMRPTRDVPDGATLRDRPEWGTENNVHLDMNPWDWLGDGHTQRALLASLRYDEHVEHFIAENNQPCRASGLQLQGVLNLLDNRAEDGGFVCVPGFQHEFDRYFTERRPRPKDPTGTAPSLSLEASDPLFRRACRVSMRAGSLVVWDQRLPHGSFGNRSARPRAAQFLKLFPRSTVPAGSERALSRERALRAVLSLLSPDDVRSLQVPHLLLGDQPAAAEASMQRVLAEAAAETAAETAAAATAAAAAVGDRD